MSEVGVGCRRGSQLLGEWENTTEASRRPHLWEATSAGGCVLFPRTFSCFSQGAHQGEPGVLHVFCCWSCWSRCLSFSFPADFA